MDLKTLCLLLMVCCCKKSLILLHFYSAREVVVVIKNVLWVCNEASIGKVTLKYVRLRLTNPLKIYDILLFI